MVDEELVTIRNHTHVALPDDDAYLYRLGVALYGFASINSFMTEIICHIDESQNKISLLDKTSGNMLREFNCVLNEIEESGKYSEIHHTMSQTAKIFKKLKNQRDDFVHAYPITSKDGEQILHRRKDKDGKYFEITSKFLDRFIKDLHDVSNRLYEIRRVVCPDL